MAALAHKFARLIRALHGTLRLVSRPLVPKDARWQFHFEFKQLSETGHEPPRSRQAVVRSGRNGRRNSIWAPLAQVNRRSGAVCPGGRGWVRAMAHCCTRGAWAMRRGQALAAALNSCVAPTSCNPCCSLTFRMLCMPPVATAAYASRISAILIRLGRLLPCPGPATMSPL